MNIDFSPIPVRSNLQPSSSSFSSSHYVDPGAAKVSQLVARELHARGVNPAILVAHCKELDLNNDGLIHLNDLEEALSEALYPQNISRRALEKLSTLLIPSNFKLEHFENEDDVIQDSNSLASVKKLLQNYRCVEYIRLLSLLEYIPEKKASHAFKVQPKESKPETRGKLKSEDFDMDISSGISTVKKNQKQSKNTTFLDYNRNEDKEETWINPREMLGQNSSRQTPSGSVGEWLLKEASPVEVKNFRRLIYCLEEFERLSGIRCVETEDGFVVPFGPELRANLSFFINKQGK